MVHSSSCDACSRRLCSDRPTAPPPRDLSRGLRGGDSFRCLNECFAVVDEHAYALRPQVREPVDTPRLISHSHSQRVGRTKLKQKHCVWMPQEALATSTREGVGKMVASTVAATTGAAAVVSAQLSSVDERFQVGCHTTSG